MEAVMADTYEQRAVFSREGGHTRGVMGRFFEHPPESLWAMLTDPSQLPQWLAPGVLELRPGGPVRLDFADSGTVIDSQIRAIEPLELLEYSWSGPGEPDRPLRWELERSEEGTRLTLTLRVPETEDAGRACAGWEAHLEMLAAALEGVPIKFPLETFKVWREVYRTELAAGPR
jgi:uncharacterized protein YndB with AHSA1/START domain